MVLTLHKAIIEMAGVLKEDIEKAEDDAFSDAAMLDLLAHLTWAFSQITSSAARKAGVPLVEVLRMAEGLAISNMLSKALADSAVKDVKES